MAILHEIDLQKDYLSQIKIDTLYFGGGTPSLLDTQDLKLVIDKIDSVFDFSEALEITIDANPDDLDPEKLNEIKKAGFNRLSIGIQSFDEELLRYFNRAHDTAMAKRCVMDAKSIGFENISADLIFGAPGQSLAALGTDLGQVIELGTPHISIYGLAIEEKTAFGKWHKKGRLIPLEEEEAARHFELIIQTLNQAGFIQYEISNFAKPGFESRHNSAYWKGKHYLGLGPSAHSYNGYSRQYNISNNSAYIKAIKENRIPCETETLSKEDQINETILIQMRTRQGLDLENLRSSFDLDLSAVKKTTIESLKASEKVIIDGNFLRLTDSGKLLADFIIEKLII